MFNPVVFPVLTAWLTLVSVTLGLSVLSTLSKSPKLLETDAEGNTTEITLPIGDFSF